MNDRPELAAGWTIDPFTGAIVHFEHTPAKKGEKMIAQSDAIHCVVTVNGTLADDGRSLHLNHYFAGNFVEAVALAGRLALGFFAGRVAEDVVAIRRATDDEVAKAAKMLGWYIDHVERLPALSDDQAAAFAADDSTEGGDQ